MSNRKIDSGELRVDGQRDGSPAWNYQPLTINHQPPQAWRRFRRNRPAVISAWTLTVIALLVVGWPICLHLARFTGPKGAAFSKNYQPEQLSEAQFQPPNFKHWFGTDVHGRDLLSR